MWRPPGTAELTPEALVDRRVRIFEMRKAGASYATIARLLHVSPSTVAADVKACLRELATRFEVGGKAALLMELARLDAVQRALWIRVVGTTEPDVDAAQVLLNVMRHRADLLGLRAGPMERGTGPGGAVGTRTPTLLWRGMDPNLPPAPAQPLSPMAAVPHDDLLPGPSADDEVGVPTELLDAPPEEGV